jgi:hypothetical protein
MIKEMQKLKIDNVQTLDLTPMVEFIAECEKVL